MDVVTIIGLAFAPGLAISLFIYLKDIHEREPFWLLLVSFLYGVVSTFITYIIAWPFESIIVFEENLSDQFVNAFLKVALIEEFSKFIFIRFILYRNKNFNEPFDGIVYAVMVGMGFATFENLLYVYQYGYAIAVIRMFTAVPSHAMFAVLMGYYLGKAKFTHSRELHYSSLALVVAILFHGLYDYFWFISFVPGIWIGAIISLIVASIFCRRAIRIHQQASPFIVTTTDEHADL